jgi:hypothetical protein
MTGWPAKLRTQGILAQWGILTLTLGASLVLVGAIAGSRHGRPGWAAATAAATACYLGAASALAVGRCFPGPQNAWKGVLAGMLPRMGIPLGFALFVYWRGGPLAEAGSLYCLLAFYPLALAVETLLWLPEAGGKRCSGVSP